MDIDRKNRLARWAFDTRPILGRFHLWLEDVEEHWIRGEPSVDWSFVGPGLQESFIMSAAVTALGTRLFGRHGEGKDLDTAGLNRVKKHADAVSAYAASESLWYLARNLPENHAIMVCLGEGLMPKAGETPEMGSNPLLGFGRVYARPTVARLVEDRVHRLINHPFYEWEAFWEEMQQRGITIWGAAIDTLENTSRFAKGSDTGPMAVIHLYDQPLNVSRPYEGYMGQLVLPNAVHDAAIDLSILLNYLTPRAKAMDAIEAAYPDIARENIHVWTLAGKSREKRLHKLWDEWRELGVHLVEAGWALPGGMGAFVSRARTHPSTASVPTWTRRARVTCSSATGTPRPLKRSRPPAWTRCST